MSLIEVLMALVIVSLAVAMLSSMGGLYQFNRDARKDTNLTAFARAYLDKVKTNWQADSAYLAVALPQDPNPTGYTYDVQVAGTQTQIFANVGSTPPTPSPDASALHTITISVKNSAQTVTSLSTLVRRPVIP